jgi:hypothetical protein
MPVIWLNPNGDAGTNEWTPSAGADHFACVDDGVQPPTNPPTTTYLSTYDYAAPQVEDFNMETAEVAAASEVIAYVNALVEDSVGYTQTIQVDVYVGGSWQLGTPVALTAAQQWISKTCTGAYTQTDIHNLRVRVTSGGDAEGAALVMYEVIAKVTYTTGGASFTPRTTVVIG